MNSNLIPFDYKGSKVRVIEQGGQPWFVATDIAATLGYASAKDCIRGLDNDEKGRQILPTPGGNQELSVISEAGLYSVILKSRVPSAREFKRWVTHEVLPSIRQRGVYATPEAVEAMLGDPDVLIQALTELKNERAERVKAQAKIEADRPKVLFADAVQVSSTSILVGELAKLITQNGVHIGQNRLFAWLRDNGYLCKQKGANWNVPQQRFVEQGLFELKESTHQQPDGSVRISRTVKVTGKGQIYFMNKFLGKKGDDAILAEQKAEREGKPTNPRKGSNK